MSQPWKLLPLAAIAAVLGALLLAQGGATRPDSASAEFANCAADQGTLIIQIIDDNTDDPVTVEGTRVELSPNAGDATTDADYVDGSGDDADNTPGQITLPNACANDANNPQEPYTVLLEVLPGAIDDCDVLDDEDSGVLEDNGSLTLVLEVDCSDLVTPTTTATATGTVGPAATVTTSASPATVACSGTSIVTIQVRDSAGKPVQAGTAVTITSNIGSVSPSSGQTTDASGSAFVFFTAPASQGGKATITAKSGNAQGTTDVTVNCGTSPTATTAPPPTVSGGGVISPPNTGEAGLAQDNGQGWTLFAAIAFVIAATAGALAIVRARA